MAKNTKYPTIDSMNELAKFVASSVTIPEKCTIGRDDIYQEVCLLWLSNGYTSVPYYMKYDLRDKINKRLNTLSSDISSGFLCDVYLDKLEAASVEEAVNTLVSDLFDDVLHTLTNREYIVICARFGIGEYALGGVRTLKETGSILSVQIETVRQIERRALSKLRHPSRSHKLKYAYDLIATIDDFLD